MRRKLTLTFWMALASVIMLVHSFIPHSHQEPSDAVQAHSHSHEQNNHAHHHHDHADAHSHPDPVSDDRNEHPSHLTHIFKHTVALRIKISTEPEIKTKDLFVFDAISVIESSIWVTDIALFYPPPDNDLIYQTYFSHGTELRGPPFNS